MKQRVWLAGRDLEFEGDEGDIYFENIAALAQGGGERHLSRFAARHLHGASVCLDVGANIGLTTASLALACPRAQIYAFEASPRKAVRLRRNLSANGLSNATVVACAAAAESGIRAAMDTIDSWSATVSAPIDFIRLNVEGNEAQVLAGAAETLVRDRPVIFMEFNSVAIAFEARRSPLSFAEMIWRLFDVFVVDEDGRLWQRDVRAFVLDNMLRHACIDDIVLDLKPDQDARSIRDALAIEVGAECAAA
ncbi:FkbM family methyltransferase [Hyphomicrobium facile]|uniref:Methyltransferase, FkbM family n=1 Tax=Hyphomicrobium facile TaxID=51670 RepID=A0A1I7MTW8_9HYPH|nr:FkbM family methyltransferase [Hyphomicrobium facile]SFV25827.1 methyltransferase, FkbM family [Hyphomicrobium facile]